MYVGIAIIILYLVGGLFTFVVMVKAEKKIKPLTNGITVVFLFAGVVWPIVWMMVAFVVFIERLTKMINRP